MRRGDVVTVAAPGDYGKPRPAIIVQTDVLPPSHLSVIVCQMTSSLAENADYRVTVEPRQNNGLRSPSQIMVDKPVTVQRERIGAIIGRLDADEIRRLNVALAFVLGLAD